MKKRNIVSLIIMVFCTHFSTPSAAGVIGPCRFNTETLRFGGTVRDTTVCLLRKVNPQGATATVQSVPDWLLSRVSNRISITPLQLERYLQSERNPLSSLTNRTTFNDSPNLRYFVIHDTSSPEYKFPITDFPSNINESSYPGNRLDGWEGLSNRVNLLIARDGNSRILVPWGSPRAKPATKIEQSSFSIASRTLFVHVENIQPRIAPNGSWGWIAPSPGLSPNQEKRLALAYIVASMHAGRWLIPAYHFNIDQGIPDAHDDPQNMNLVTWVEQIAQIEAEILN